MSEIKFNKHLNSNHYKNQQLYLEYLQSIKVEDIVYPGYDGKSKRCTPYSYTTNMLVVFGCIWLSMVL